MDEYERGFLNGMRHAQGICSAYAFEHLQDGHKTERAVGANSVATVIRLQVEASKRDIEEKHNER